MSHKRATLITSVFGMAAGMAAAAQPVELTPPDVIASIADDPRDGTPDSISIAPDDSFAGLLREQSTRENRAIQEFDIAQFAGTNIISARISGFVRVNNSFDNGERTFDFGIYEGDGEATLSDFAPDVTIVGSGSYAPPNDTFFAFEFDVTEEVQAIVDNGGQWVGLHADPTSSPNFPNILDDDEGDAVLTIEAEEGDDCPADLTGPGGDGVPDGALTSDDFFFYLGLFADGDLAADLTGPGGDGVPDGALTSDDFFFYLGLFAAGCP